MKGHRIGLYRIEYIPPSVCAFSGKVRGDVWRLYEAYGEGFTDFPTEIGALRVLRDWVAEVATDATDALVHVTALLAAKS